MDAASPSSIEPSSAPSARALMQMMQAVVAQRSDMYDDLASQQARLAESKRSHATRLLFCTTGVLLRRLHADRDLSGVSHVIVDEVTPPTTELKCPDG